MKNIITILLLVLFFNKTSGQTVFNKNTIDSFVNEINKSVLRQVTVDSISNRQKIIIEYFFSKKDSLQKVTIITGDYFDHVNSFTRFISTYYYHQGKAILLEKSDSSMSKRNLITNIYLTLSELTQTSPKRKKQHNAYINLADKYYRKSKTLY